MRKSIHLLAAVAALGLAGGAIASTKTATKPAPAAAKAPAKAAQKAPKPKLSMHQARAIAHKAAPGKIISSEYEMEGGAYRYSFDIQQKNNVQEIGVDPNTGKIIENKSEGKTDVDKKREAREASAKKTK
jgi:uncharacterized membrane protein YkoI